jgi:hypothetical protein
MRWWQAFEERHHQSGSSPAISTPGGQEIALATRSVTGPSCPRCGSTDLELETASLDGETADETTIQRCRACNNRFSVTAKRD